MNKRTMMNQYCSEAALHSSELSLKFGIADGTIRLNGSEISGDTYDARLAIKSYFAARWNAEKKCWTICKDQAFAENIFANGLIV